MFQVDILVAQAIVREREQSLGRRAEQKRQLAEAGQAAGLGVGARRSVGMAVIRLGEALAGQAGEEFGVARGRLSSAG
ncbi:MAG TPA: hypothetical protein VMU89_03895 [Thermomicrobiaceae bacterium]|nr:hypothetical protein [Thermomicrobiaceae bacterium]